MQFVVNCEGKTPVDHHRSRARPARSLAEMRIDFCLRGRSNQSLLIDWVICGVREGFPLSEVGTISCF